MIAIVAHCRAGFEPEAAADLRSIVASIGTSLDVDASTGRGFIVAAPHAFDAPRWPRALTSSPPIFVRSLFFGTGPHTLLDPATAPRRPDRVIPLVEQVEHFRLTFPVPGPAVRPQTLRSFGDVRLEIADTNTGKALSGLCRAVEPRLRAALQERALLAPQPDPALPTLHLLFVDGARVLVGASRAPWRSRWPMGIPRLRMPRAAPSRSALKLAEALVTFLGDREPVLLRAGMRAVDLGAAPGGWTWQLAQRGLRVTAVDNGALKGDVANDSLVTHLRTDGLAYVPRRPVDWLFCDIAESPSRIATLVARWIASGYARHAIFNLKLPMKKRYAEVQRCAAIVRDSLTRARVRHTLVLRQLYHDREEVTGFVERIA